MKKCTKCNCEKPYIEFSKNKSKKTGYNVWCKSCYKYHYSKNKKLIANNAKYYYKKNRINILEKNKAYAQINKTTISLIRKNKRSTGTGVAKELLRGALRRSKINNLKFDIDLEFVTNLVVDTKVCPVTKEKFVFGNGKIANNSRTLDRIIPELGYIKTNVILVSNLANKVKNNGTIENIREIYIYQFK